MSDKTINITIKIPDDQQGLFTAINRAIKFFKSLIKALERGEKV